MLSVRRSTVLALLTALVVAAYGPSLFNELVFDDLIFMEHDPRVRALDQSLRLFVEPLWGFTDQGGRTYAHQYYRPLQTLPLALSHALFGEAAWPSHLLNLVVHWLNVLMVFALTRRVMKGSRDAQKGSSDQGIQGSSPDPHSISRSLHPLIPTATAAVFAVHPGYCEAVLWASNIAGLGVAACTLAILLIHASAWAARRGAALLMAVLFLGGLWFKESGILVPILMALYDLLVAPTRGWRRILRAWPRYAILLVPGALYYWLRLRALGGALPGFDSVPLTGFELVINAVALLPQYVVTFLWPVDLNMYHDFDAIHSVRNARFLGGAALLALATLGMVASWRQRPVVSFGVAWILITAAPHLVARWPQLNVFAERYLYLPAVGAFLIAADAAGRMPRVHRSRRTLWATAALVLVAVIIDVRRSADWRDEVTIYAKTLTQSRRAELIRINLGLRYYQLGRYDEGITVLKELIAFDPSWHDAWHNLGLLYLAQQRDAEATDSFEKARLRDPSSGETLLNLGFLYDRQGRRDDALDAYFRAVRAQPDNVKAWYNLAAIAIELKQFGNARQAIHHILAAAPEDRDARALAARAEGETVAPPPAADTERRCADSKRAVDEGRFEDAIIGLRVAAWYDEASPLPHQYLANVFYLAGRIPQAVAHQREALARAPDNVLYQRNLASLEGALRAK